MDTQSSEQATRLDRKTAGIGLAAILLGFVVQIPAIILLLVVGSFAWVGVKFLWSFFKLFT